MTELIALQGRWNLVHTQAGDLCSCGQRADLTSVSTLRTLTWFGLWWAGEVDFGNQGRVEPHIAHLRLLLVCHSTQRGQVPVTKKGFWRSPEVLQMEG